MVALDPPNVITVPLDEALGEASGVPLESDSICTAREVGISFGD